MNATVNAMLEFLVRVTGRFLYTLLYSFKVDFSMGAGMGSGEFSVGIKPPLWK